MYKYEEPSLFSGKRGVAFIIVILLHVVVGWGFYTGLAQKFITKVIPPVEVAEIDKPKQEDKPPPPPPKLEELKPYVPPPEFVDIQQAPPENAPVAQSAVNNVIAPPAPAAPPAPPAPVARTGVRPDPKHPVSVDDYYPDASKRANEEGKCLVKVTIGTDGKTSDPAIETGTGFPRLDEACLKLTKAFRFVPATENGKPVAIQTVVPFVFKFKQ
jgi:protein TonB